MKPYLSVVIPAYNEEKRLAPMLLIIITLIIVLFIFFFNFPFHLKTSFAAERFNWQNADNEIISHRTYDTKDFDAGNGKHILIQSGGLLHAYTDIGFQDIEKELPDYSFPEGKIIDSDGYIMDLPEWGTSQTEADGTIVKVYDKKGTPIFRYANPVLLKSGEPLYTTITVEIQNSSTTQTTTTQIVKNSAAIDTTFSVSDNKLYLNIPPNFVFPLQAYDYDDIATTDIGGDNPIWATISLNDYGPNAGSETGGYIGGSYTNRRWLTKGTLPSGSGTINSVKLFMYYVWATHTGNPTTSVNAYQNTASWNENTATYNNQPAHSATIVDTMNPQYPNNPPLWCDWNLGAEATNPISGLTWGSSVDLKLIADTEAQESIRWFASREYTADISKRPYIEIVYSAGAPQLPIISNFNQYKSDGITSIQESQTTTENAVVFKTKLDDPNGDDVKFEIELRRIDEFGGAFLNIPTATSAFTMSNSTAIIVVYGLLDGQYHWQVRAVDIQGNKSDWQEFGQVGNVDFMVKMVPLYTQIYSPYPSTTTTFIWSQRNYAYAIPEKPYGCGFNIGDCGCAIASEVMITRFYGITTTIDGKNVDPANFNEWSINNDGYYLNGDVKWPKINDYSKDQFGVSRLVYSNPVNSEDANILNGQLDNLQPTMLNTQVLNRQGKLVDHFIVADGKLSNTYTVKDPVYYLTRNLNQPRSSYIYDYDNHFVGLRLFSPIAILPDSISAHFASPGELLFIDSLGRKLGRDPISNAEYNEIPGGVYYQESIGNSESDIAPEKSKNIWIPEPIDGKYDIQVIGVESGTYTLSTLIYDQTGQSKDAVQEGNTSANNIQNFELDYSAASVQQSEIYRIVDIDIKPGSYPNSINLKSKGATPVAILTNPFFDAKDVVIDSVLFAEAKPLRGNLEDIDNDGDLDLILHFNTQSFKLNPADSETVLTGELTNGNLIQGTDSVRIIQGVVRQTILEKLLSYINQVMQNFVSSGLAAIQ